MKKGAVIDCAVCSKKRYLYQRDLRRKRTIKEFFCSVKCKGIFFKGKRVSQSTEFKKGSVGPWKGKTRPDISERQKGNRSNLWRGGITPINLMLRKSVEYRLWRTAVFERDNYTCVSCNVRGGRLDADHIKSFSKYPELRFDLSNGRTLCRECHKKTDNWGWRSMWANRGASRTCWR